MELAEPFVDRLQPIHLLITYTNNGPETRELQISPISTWAGELYTNLPQHTGPLRNAHEDGLGEYFPWVNEEPAEPATLGAGQTVQLRKVVP